jgi:hypothetical protein
MNNATDSILLPQYTYSEEFMERFLQAIHKEGASITRSPNIHKIKRVDGTELESDYLDYFSDNKVCIEDEFYSELASKIGEQKTRLFCAIISKYWYDGRKKRNSRLVKSLKWGVRCYLDKTLKITNLHNIVQNDITQPYKQLFTASDIAAILTVNDQNLHKHIDLWSQKHPRSTEIGRGDIFFKRGLSCPEIFAEGHEYKEWDYINSYSLAISAPEQFSQMTGENVSIILSADCDYFQSRVLFFSPFIRGMDVGQLELGIIPNNIADRLHYQGEHGGIHEYLIGHHVGLEL